MIDLIILTINKKHNRPWLRSQPNWANRKRQRWITAFFSEANIRALELRGIDPYIATGREAHHKDLKTLLGQLPEAPSDAASPKEKMAYKLASEIGHAIYRLRKCTVEPVIGIIKEILGFRQFSLRGLKNVMGREAWCLVCLAFNLKRMHILWIEQGLY